MNFLTFLLDGQTSTTPENGGGGSGFELAMPMIIMVVMLIAMWWFGSRSQKKRDKEAQDMRDSLQIGDEVTTIGGIIGKVVSIKDETFVLETTKEKTHIRFLKAAIRSIDVKISDTVAVEAKDEPEEKANEDAPVSEKKGLFKNKKK